MPGTPTTRFAIPTVAGTDLARDLDTEITAGFTAVDSKMTGWGTGLLAARPVSTGGSPGVAGRIYRATDTGQWFIDTGTSWEELPAAPLADADLASPNNGVPRTIFGVAGASIQAGFAAATYLLANNNIGINAAATDAEKCPVWTPDAADYAVAGKTTELRIIAHMITNGVAPGVNFTPELRRITAVSGGSGTAMDFTTAAGIATAAAAPSSAAAGTRVESSWVGIATLTAGMYVWAVTTAGAAAASSLTSLSLALEMRHV